MKSKYGRGAKLIGAACTGVLLLSTHTLPLKSTHDPALRSLAIAAHGKIAKEFPREAGDPVTVSCVRHEDQPKGSRIGCAVYVDVGKSQVLTSTTSTKVFLPIGKSSYTYTPTAKH
jgi:hypothetical protein